MNLKFQYLIILLEKNQWFNLKKRFFPNNYLNLKSNN